MEIKFDPEEVEKILISHVQGIIVTNTCKKKVTAICNGYGGYTVIIEDKPKPVEPEVKPMTTNELNDMAENGIMRGAE